jgi:tetratricopeptide (TPR) repeat protein
MWAAFAVAFLAYSGLLSFAARKDATFLQYRLVHVAAIAGFFGLLYPVAQALGPLLVMPIALAGAALGIPFISYLIGDWFERAVHTVSGAESMKIRRTYDSAEKAEREGRVDEALDLYRQECGRVSEDPEPLRRTGELLLRKGDTAGALAAFRSALPLLQEPEPHSTLAFRIADLEERAGRPEEARRILEDVARRYPGTRFETYARARLGTSA